MYMYGIRNIWVGLECQCDIIWIQRWLNKHSHILWIYWFNAIKNNELRCSQCQYKIANVIEWQPSGFFSCYCCCCWCCYCSSRMLNATLRTDTLNLFRIICVAYCHHFSIQLMVLVTYCSCMCVLYSWFTPPLLLLSSYFCLECVTQHLKCLGMMYHINDNRQ